MVSWHAPDIMEELSELRRTSKDLGISLQEIFNAVENGSLQKLSTEMWDELENTDSNTIKSEKEAKKLARAYGKDYEVIEEAFKDDTSLPAPIILLVPDSSPYLVAGNTRLMAAKASDETPDVWIADLSNIVEAQMGW